MRIRFDRIQQAQALMRRHNMLGIMVMNHDDYRYFFGASRSQPRAIIPFSGPPVLIAFAAEQPQLEELVGSENVRIFTHVGEQIADVKSSFREIFGKTVGVPVGGCPGGEGKPKIGMQMWFHTPAFLVDMFRKINSYAELVPSDPVMDALRMIKDAEEIELMRKAQEIAAMGMDRTRELLHPGARPHDIATEVTYTMMKAGASSTSTPIYVNVGIDTCQIHGGVSSQPIESGQLVVIDLTPMYEGYCANLARTFVLGEPDERQRQLLTAYEQMKETSREMLRPGVRVKEIDAKGKAICDANELGEYHIDGISHGIGLRFEEPPASTIIKPHRNIELQEGMTVTAGHTILAIPGFGGVRHEDIYRVTCEGGEILYPYTVEPEIRS